MSLTGEFRHSIDAKGRLIVPSRLRDELGDQVVLTSWLEDCISVWSAASFEEKVVAPLVAERTGLAEKRTIARVIGSRAHQDVIDGQGRVTVPQTLRQNAGIDRDVLVIGALDHAEIWNPDRWEQEMAKVAEGGFEQLARQLNF